MSYSSSYFSHPCSRFLGLVWGLEFLECEKYNRGIQAAYTHRPTHRCRRLSPLPPPDDACSAAAFRSRVNLRGVDGAAAAEATPIVLAVDCPLLRCTTLMGGDVAPSSGADFPGRARATFCRQGVSGAGTARVATDMVVWGESSGVSH